VPHSEQISIHYISQRHKHCDYKIELFPVHSQLLRESDLVSFPPLIYMLKSRGLPCFAWLVRYKLRMRTIKTTWHINVAVSCWSKMIEKTLEMRHKVARWCWSQECTTIGVTNDCLLRSKIWWFTEFCNSHYLSHFATFFIVPEVNVSSVKTVNCKNLRTWSVYCFPRFQYCKGVFGCKTRTSF
jgi:hypothetical protein